MINKKNKIKKEDINSMAGSLKEYFKNQTYKEVIKELQNERRKSDRY